MKKVYSDPNPGTKKWSVYVEDHLYKKFKRTSIDADENINEMVSEALEVYLSLFPVIEDLRRDAGVSGKKLGEYILQHLKMK